MGKCDLFLGLITPSYGSGKEDEAAALSIPHRELLRAIELGKPRWLLAHDHVVFARSLLMNLGHANRKARAALKPRKTAMLDDLRVIDMYEDAILSDKPVRDRQGNWVQKYRGEEEATLFATAQFFRYQEVEAFVKENFADTAKVAKTLRKGGRR